MSVEHRPDRLNPWRARVRTFDGREVNRSFRRKVDGEAWVAEQKTDLRRGGWVDPQAGRMLWGEWSELLLAGRQHLAPRTCESDRTNHRRAARWLGTIPLAGISAAKLRRMMSELSTQYSLTTVSHTMRWVKYTLRQAVLDRRLVVDPGVGVKVSKPGRGPMRLLTPGEVADVAGVLPDRYRTLPVVAAYTGLRWGELVGLGPGAVDLLRRRLRVEATLVEAGGVVRLGPPKSKASGRTLTLPMVVVDEMARHLADWPASHDLVWTRPDGQPMRRSFSKTWLKAVDETVGRPCRFHDLRHTHASWLIAQGEHPKTIQTRLGHASITTTMDRYGHLMEGLDVQTAGRLDTLAKSSSGPNVAQTFGEVVPLEAINSG